MQVIINPGSGPVEGATAADAKYNISAFVGDLGLSDVKVRRKRALDSGGRYGFVLTFDSRKCEITMPGLPLEQVRWMNEPEQDIWDFPRLYVDGSSWVWKFALNSAGGTLRGE
jgi:hypothetical protein